MHIIHEEIGLPKITFQEIGKNTARFTISPLPNGYGRTLGNTLRRVLLSSVPGAAITAVRIEGVSHEYSTIPGMKESVLDFCLNLKKVAVQKHGKGIEIASLSTKREGEIFAKDIHFSSDVEYLNPDFPIAFLGKKSDGIKAEIKLDKGVGYLPAAQQQREAEEGENWIYIDATFSPVTRVRYDVSATRVGENTNLDKLEVEVETNGSLSPEDAVKFSSNILQSYFSFFQREGDLVVESDFMTSSANIAIPKEEEYDDAPQESYTPIEVLNLSPRTLNALINGEIGSIEELVKCSPAKLENLRGFGKKAMDEVRDILATRGFSLTEEEE
ncbi:DNA-directed RNA polymerase subunit alpha [Candidatus Peregrinibacteria bacterium]|nr:MAG: DNA-directed RNA polymerase subunit alpha [Candidatus Peregrinibacteria bacterium]